MFKIDGPVARILNAFADLVILSAIWFLACLTIVGIGPATVALYYTVVKSIRRDRGAPYREFFHCIGVNWKMALGMGLLFTVLGAALFRYDLPRVLSLFHAGTPIPKAAAVVSILKIALIGSIAIYVFPLISRYQVTVFGVLKTALALMARNFYYTFVMLAVFVAAAMLLQRMPYLILVLPGAICYVQSIFLEPILNSLLSEEDLENARGDDQWYLG